MYRPVPAQVDLPALEHEVLDFWRERDVFARSPRADQRRRAQWVFYEGPPTANGMPGTHHVEARVFKDVFPRFQTMKGRHVPRKAGWDCHGLPVELAVETELGFRGKQDIEAYGIAEFNAQVPRVGDAPRRRVRGDDRADGLLGRPLPGLLDDGPGLHRERVVVAASRSSQGPAGPGPPGGALLPAVRDRPCPTTSWRRATRRSSTRRSTCGFPVTGGPLANLGATLLVWTTTPWTLVSNTAVAVNPDVTYVAARTDGRRGARRRRAAAVRRRSARTWRSWSVATAGATWTLRRTSDRSTSSTIPDAHFVVLADYVTVEDGTGLVHQAPAFGADDLAVGRALRPAGGQPDHGRRHTSPPTSRWSAAMFFKKADATLVADLEQRGLLFRHVPYEHSYPHCWRCHTPLLYYAQPSWYIRTTAIKDRMLAENERTNWFPPTIKNGRYGDWLNNNVDWALSRNRYWGTPLPIWRCADDHLTVRRRRWRSSASLAGRDLSELDPHRPYIDEVVITCPECGQQADAGARGHRRAGTTPARCRSPSGATRTQRGRAVRVHLPGTVHLRGDRPDPRLVLHADGDRHARLRPVRRTRTWSASATSSTRTAARCPSTSATSWSRSR